MQILGKANQFKLKLLVYSILTHEEQLFTLSSRSHFVNSRNHFFVLILHVFQYYIYVCKLVFCSSHCSRIQESNGQTARQRNRENRTRGKFNSPCMTLRNTRTLELRYTHTRKNALLKLMYTQCQHYTAIAAAQRARFICSHAEYLLNKWPIVCGCVHAQHPTRGRPYTDIDTA